MMTMVYLTQERLAVVLTGVGLDPERASAVIAMATAESARARVIAQHEQGEELAMMIRMLTSALKRHWPHAPQPGDLPCRAIDLLRRHDLLGSPLRDATECENCHAKAGTMCSDLDCPGRRAQAA